MADGMQTDRIFYGEKKTLEASCCWRFEEKL